MPKILVSIYNLIMSLDEEWWYWTVKVVLLLQNDGNCCHLNNILLLPLQIHVTVEPHYNEVSRYQKKCLLYQGLCYSEDPAITNYLVNNKNIGYSGVTKLNNGLYTTQNSEQPHLNKAKLWRSKFPYLDQ